MKLFYFTIVMIMSASLYAQNAKDTINIEEVIIRENRFSTPISKKNRNVYVIDKTTIEQLPARTIQEILQYANGIDLRQRGPFGSQADISVDGGSFEQTVVLLNGTKIIDSQTAHNMLNLPIPVDAIERIEVIRGPAALIYGINSLTGAINIITKKPTHTGISVNSYLGSNFQKDTQDTGDTFYGRGIQLGAAVSKEKHQHALAVSHDKSNGYRYNTAFENNKLFYQGNVQIDEANEILSSFGYIRNGFGANGFYASPGDKNSNEIVQTTLANIQSKHTLSDKWTLMPQLSYRYNYDDYRYFGNANLNAGRSQHYTNSFSAEVNATYKTNRGEWGVGIEGRNEAINSTNINTHSRENLGFYLQYRTHFFTKLDVSLGSYINYNSSYNWQIYPGIDASYALSDSFKIIGNMGTSQRIPSFTDLYLNQRPGNIGNPDLQPENAFQGELGLKYTKPSFTFNVNYFQRKINHFIDWNKIVATEPWQSNNSGNLLTTGFNLRLNYQHSFSTYSKLHFNVAYSYLGTEFSHSKPILASKYLIESLKHQITNTIDYKFKNTTLLLANRYNQRASGTSYWINDIRLNQTIKKCTVYIDAQNIFNSTYYEVGAVPLPARWFSLGVKYATF